MLLEFLTQVVLAQFLADGSSRDHKHTAEIGLQQNTNRVPTEIQRQTARCGPNATLSTKGNCSGARANGALIDRSTLGIFDGGENIRGRDVTAANVVQISVVRLTYHRVHG